MPLTITHLRAPVPPPRPQPERAVRIAPEGPGCMEYVKWTPELEAQLRDLWEEGMTATAIAQELPAMMTRNAVLGKVRRLALPKRA